MDDDRDLASGFVDRLTAAVGTTAQAVVAKRAQISSSAFSRYFEGTVPSLVKAARIAKALDVSLQWLATGEGDPNAEAAGFVGVPIYDVRLAAGAATFVDGARKIGEHPLDRDILRQLRRSNADGLAVLMADGDSMEPTIQDGGRVLVDTNDDRLRDGIYGFRLDDELRVKRLRRVAEGVEVLSDNARYPRELIAGHDLERFAIIGRAQMTVSFL